MQDERLLEIFRTLADRNRLAIFQLLMTGAHCNCEIGQCLALPANLISHHLKVLREAGFIDAKRHPTDGRWIIYSINRETLEQARSLTFSFFDPERLGTRHPDVCASGAMPSCRSDEHSLP